MTRGFLKQQLSVSTGSTVSQIESGVFSSNTKRDPYSRSATSSVNAKYRRATSSVKTKCRSATSSVNTMCENYFAKIADSHQVTKPYDIERNGWGLDVQRLDGTKLSVHVECCEVSIIIFDSLPYLLQLHSSVPLMHTAWLLNAVYIHTS